MEYLSVKTRGSEIKIQKYIFESLFCNNIANEDKVYIEAIKNNYISFVDLKEISHKYQVPYPLLFADRRTVDLQIYEFKKRILDKFPIKNDIFYNSRANHKFDPEKILLIIKDISRKQLFLRKIEKPQDENPFIGLLKENRETVEFQAQFIREYFDINIEEIKRMPKKISALEYIINKAESKKILVSASSHNFMPQQIDPDQEFSGLCIKDKYYPWIFVNNKDNQVKPAIIETEGRKILTVIFIICNIAIKDFSRIDKKSTFNKAYSLALEVLLPKEEMKTVHIHNTDDLIKFSSLYKVTPSLLLERLNKLLLIEKTLYKFLRSEILANRKNIENSSFHNFSYVNRYAKYNGVEFSHIAVRKYLSNYVSENEFRNIVFKSRKVSDRIFRDYCKKFNY